MEKEGSKPWERPWTTDEIREHSANWNLAGDSGLLNHLQQFSQNLLASTHATEVALDKLMEDLETTSTSVQDATNTFLFLANTQFVENRVYDDDEKETPPEEKRDDLKPPKTKEEQEAEVFQNVKQALQMGLSLLDTHFEAVEVPASDSEEEESSASVGRLVLKPKNPYISRPLPYLIGSREFMEDDKVGLGEISSDTEESPDQNIVQSSESDDEMEHDELIITPKRPITLSSSDLEDSESNHDGETLSKQKRPRTSTVGTLREEEKERDMFGQESSPEADVVSIAKGGMKSAFSDELASKLGAVKPQNVSERENVKDNLFVPSPEPEDDELFSKGSHSFTDKQGLFDDLEDWQSTSDSLWKNDNVSAAKPTVVVSKGPQPERAVNRSDVIENVGDKGQDEEVNSSSKMKTNTINANISEKEKMSSSTPKGGSILKPKIDVLFEPTDETDDLFNQKVKDIGSASGKPALFGKDNQEDDDLFAIPSSTDNLRPGPSENLSKRKKLPGAVPVFSGVNLFGDISPIVQQDSTTENISEQNILSGGNDLPSQEPSSGLGSSSDVLKKDGESESQDHAVASKEKSHLFDSQSDQWFQNVVTSTKVSDVAPGKSSLFKTEIDSDSLFEKARSSDQKNLIASKTSASLSSNLKSKAKKTVSLFDDSDSGDDELLFSSTSSTSSRSRRSQGSGDVLGGTVEKRILPKKELFDDSLLFGVVNKDEPDVDIFSSQNEPKSKSSSFTKDNAFSENDVFSDNLTNSKKVTSNLFDDIDEVDDIFAVPKVSSAEIPKKLGIKSQTDLGKLSLFSDDLGSSNNIFLNKVDERQKKEVTPVSEVPSQHDNVVSSIPNVFGGISSSTSLSPPKDTSVPVSAARNESIVERDTLKKAKPALSQKPNVPVKPTLQSISSQNNLSSSQSSSVPKFDRNNSSVSVVRTEGTKKLSDVGANDHAHDFNNDALVRKVCDDQPPVSSVKPEPPRTLNIRKTTDIVFGSPSNEEDDFFESAYSDKLPARKEAISNEKLKNPTLSSNNFSKLLEGVDSSSANIASTVSSSNDLNSNGSEGNNKNLDSSGTLDVNATHKTISSPIKLLIDPRTLLPGARPPSNVVSSDEAIGFDKPAEKTSTLHSAAKERVKIQVKRRPQTRRARQEALRASSIEYDNIDAALISQVSNNKNDNVQNSLISTGASSSSVNNATPKVFEPDGARNSQIAEKNSNSVSDKDPKNNSEGQSPVSEYNQLSLKTEALKNVLSDCLSGNSNALSPLTDEEDIFAVPHELPFDESSNKEMSNDSKNLFGGAPVLSPMEEKANPKNLIHSSLEIEGNNDIQTHLKGSVGSNDLFEGNFGDSEVSSSICAPDKSKSTTMPSAINNADVLVKHSDSKWLDYDLEKSSEKGVLFDDICEDDAESDDDDDLFSSKQKHDNSRNKTKKNTPEVRSQKPLFSPEVTLENTSKEYEERKKNISDEFPKSPIQETSSTCTEPITSKNVSGDDRMILSHGTVRESSPSKKSDDLFAGNKNIKEIKVGSSVRNSENNFSQERVKSRVVSLFGDDATESDDLFGSSSVPKMPMSGQKVKNSKELLFDVGDDDDDIFTLSLKKNKGPKSDVLFPKDEDSLPNSEKDNDDLFSKRSNSSKNQGSKPSSSQKVPSFEDPLTLFNK